MVKKGTRLLKIVLMLFIIINILIFNHTVVYADKSQILETEIDQGEGGTGTGSGTGTQKTPFDVSKNPNSWRPTVSTSTIFETKVNIILGVVQIIGIIVSVASISIIGIKFMLGSVEEKAQYKQTLLPWLIGAIMIFAITTIPTMIYDMTKAALKDPVGETQSAPLNPGGGKDPSLKK